MGEPRGAKHHILWDWPFGARDRRLLLESLYRLPAPNGGWTKSALAREIGSSPNGTLDRHLAGLVQWRVVSHSGGRFWLADHDSPIRDPLRELVSAVHSVPDQRLRPLTSRRYRQES
jgi:hypothetical protein